MSKFAIVNDSHHGVRNGSPVFLNYFDRFYSETFFPFVQANKIKTIVHLGDFLDKRRSVDFRTLQAVDRYFLKPITDLGLNLIIIPGNHDAVWRHSLDINSPTELLKDNPNVTVHVEPVELDMDGTKIALVPWICDENQEQCFRFIRDTKAQILMGHFEIAGFAMQQGHIHEAGLDRKMFAKFDMVISGHYHAKSEANGIHYLGTQYQLTWDDYGEDKFFHTFDTKTRTLEAHPGAEPMFHKIVYADDYDDDLSHLTDCYVRVIVKSKSKHNLWEAFLEHLNFIGPADLTIDDMTILDHEEIEVDIDNALEKNTLTLLFETIDAMPSNRDKVTLKTLIAEIHSEVLRG